MQIEEVYNYFVMGKTKGSEQIHIHIEKQSSVQAV